MITLQEVVANAFSDKDISLSKWSKYLQWAIRGYRLLNGNFAISVRSRKFVPSQTNTINCPPDYVTYKRIGVLIDNEIYTLSENPNLGITFDIVAGKEVMPDGLTDSKFTDLFQWVNAPQGTYNIGFYREDIENRRIILQGSLSEYTIYMEYISNGITPEKPIFVPEYCLEPLIAFLHWQDELSKDNYNAARERERIYNDKLDEMTDIKWAFSPDEFMDALRSGYTQNVKL